MKFSVCACILFYFVVTGSAFPRPGRPHPLYGNQQQYGGQNDFLTMALLMGFDFNELLALQAASGRGLNNIGLGNLGVLTSLSQLLSPQHGGSRLAQQRARQDMNTLSLLGIVDGPDVPDGPAGRAGRGRAGRRIGPPKAGGAAAAGGEGGAGARGEAAEGAAAAAKPKRRGPRRQGPSRVGPGRG